MPAYEDVVRAFNIDPKDYYIDIWDHLNVRQYKGKHPAEKPLDLLELIIRTSTYEGDIVLDAFSGSGATLVAASNLSRRSIGMEIDDHWIRYSADRIAKETRQSTAMQERKNSLQVDQAHSDLPLFSD